MASRQTRSKDSSVKQSRELRPRRIIKVTTKPQQKTSNKRKTSTKRKRKCEIEDVVDGPNLFTIGKRSKLLDALPPAPLRWRSKDITPGKTEEVDGGPLDLYPMKRRGPFYIIRKYQARISLLRHVPFQFIYTCRRGWGLFSGEV